MILIFIFESFRSDIAVILNYFEPEFPDISAIIRVEMAS